MPGWTQNRMYVRDGYQLPHRAIPPHPGTARLLLIALAAGPCNRLGSTSSWYPPGIPNPWYTVLHVTAAPYRAPVTPTVLHIWTQPRRS